MILSASRTKRKVSVIESKKKYVYRKLSLSWINDSVKERESNWKAYPNIRVILDVSPIYLCDKQRNSKSFVKHSF